MKKFQIILLGLILGTTLHAQNGAVRGKVLDESSGTPLAGATILLSEEKGTATDRFGTFNIPDVLPGLYEVEIRFLGFEHSLLEIEVQPGKDTRIEIPLKPSALQLSDVEVTSDLKQQNSQISQLEIKLRPINTSQDVLKIVPGLFIAQHAGGGKAEQIFLRGFDIDHGTDIALNVDGMPVNMVSHSHGQGYSDLHFVIPETIQRVNFDKGPYYFDHGNFNTAGYANFFTRKRLDSNTIKLEGGQFGTFRGVGLFNLLNAEEREDPSLYLASEYAISDGYFESPQGFKRFNSLLKFHQQISAKNTLEVSASAFSSTWSASGQIPERAVRNGSISRFGAIDDTEGGTTARYNVNALLTTQFDNGGILTNQAYYSHYDFKLYSNFTFFLNDPVNGDQITQSESRDIIGAKSTYWQQGDLFGLSASTEIGLSLRHDKVADNRLSRTKNRSEVLTDLSRGDINETNVALFAEEVLKISPGLELSAGARYDYFSFTYQDRLSNETQQQSKGIFSPKLQLSHQLNKNLTLYAKTGIGFHSNDARVVVAQEGQQILPKALGIDLGTYWKPTDKLYINFALWQLNLEQEFVFVGDEGIVEAGGRTERRGIDFSLKYQFNTWLYAYMDLNLTDARSLDVPEAERFIPLAPTSTSIGGLNFNFKNGFSGSLNYRYLDDRAANEDYSLTAEGYLLLDATFGYQIGNLQFGLEVENLMNEEWNEAQFETESRLFNELQPVSEIHFTPGTPFRATFSIGLSF